MKIRTITLASSALAAALILTGCSTTPANNATGGSPSSTAPSVVAANFNNADETFVMGMIAHHEQAVEMADMLLEKDGVDERVIGLALDIKDAQGPEIDTMNNWLDAWGIMAADSGMEGMDHSGGMMMSDDDMAALDNATGSQASKLFLEQMTEHHQGAIDMAQQELANGENTDALSLAQKIIDDQTAEIATMKSILDTL
jgi:uncharacterized protein (DUF305 family)